MVPNTSTHKTVPLFASILIKAWLTTNISKDQTMIALQLKGKMITAFKPSKPDRPKTHCLKRDKSMKKGFLAVMMKTPKETSVLIAFQKTYSHLGHKNGGRSTIGRTRPQNNMFEKNKTSTQRTLQQSNTTHCMSFTT